MKRVTLAAFLLTLASSALLTSCSGNNAQATDEATGNTETTQTEAAPSGVTIENIQVTSPLNAEKVAAGKQIYELKCQACHKLTEEKLVGPGWKEVTKRRSAGWIVSMITNTDKMLDSDPDAQKLLEEILVRMPNQNVSKEDALKVLEFMRSNDGEK